ncbi:MAG: hypothetical protein ACJ79S_09965 [Gemmatimonadaceae bacterium]
MLRSESLARLDAVVGSASSTVVRERDGGNPVERRALARVRREVAAMPASLVVQLAIWPDEIAAWARGEGTHESLVYNMLARRKPYQRVRERLAERLEVPTAVLAHLIDARRPLPFAKREPPRLGDPPPDAGSGEPPIDWAAPPYPLHRDGTNPIERRAVRVVERDVASMPASAVVGLALWPETLAEWSREQRLKASVVWATLAGSPSERIRSELARRIDVTRRDLDDLVATARARPSALRVPGPAADVSESAVPDGGVGVDVGPPDDVLDDVLPGGEPSPGGHHGRGSMAGEGGEQITLGF